MSAPVAQLAQSQCVAAAIEVRLRELADAPVFTVFQQLGGSPRGLTEAADRSHRFGPNESGGEVDQGVDTHALAAVRNPFVVLLAGLGVVFATGGDIRGAATAAVGSLLPLTPLASALRMTALPLAYGLWLVAYRLAAQLVQQRYLRRHREWL